MTDLLRVPSLIPCVPLITRSLHWSNVHGQPSFRGGKARETTDPFVHHMLGGTYWVIENIGCVDNTVCALQEKVLHLSTITHDQQNHQDVLQLHVQNGITK
jgi:hypothetical protein